MSKTVKTIFFLAGLSIFTFLVINFGIQQIAANIRETGFWFIPIIGIWGVAYLLNAWAWYLIIGNKAQSIGFGEIFSITLSGFAINYITPVVNLGGEPYRILTLKESIGTRRAVSSTVLYTMIHYLSHFIFWLAAIILISLYSPLSASMKMVFALIALLLLGAIALFISRHKRGILVALYTFLCRIPLLKKYLKRFSDRNEEITRIDEQITDFYHKKRNSFYAALGLDFLSRIITAVEFWFILSAVGIEISPLEAIYISAGSSLIMNILFFMPLELGTREGGIMLVMSGLQFAGGIGVYVGLVNRIREFFWILIGLLLIQLRKSRASHKQVVESV